MGRVVTREALETLRQMQALEVAIESVERDLDRACWSFSEAMTLHAHLQRLRALRASLAEGSREAEDEEVQTAVI